jgi:hypothetical protein
MCQTVSEFLSETFLSLPRSTARSLECYPSMTRSGTHGTGLTWRGEKQEYFWGSEMRMSEILVDPEGTDVAVCTAPVQVCMASFLYRGG